MEGKEFFFSVADGSSYIVVVLEKSDARYDRYNGYLATNSIWDESMRVNWKEHKYLRKKIFSTAKCWCNFVGFMA